MATAGPGARETNQHPTIFFRWNLSSTPEIVIIVVVVVAAVAEVVVVVVVGVVVVAVVVKV